MTKENKNLEEIVKEFEELFAERGVIGDRKFKEYCTGIYEDILEWHIRTLTQYHQEIIKEVIEMCEGMRKDLKWFEDNYFTAENAYPSYDKKRDRWVGVTAKETYNQAIDDIITRLKDNDQ